MVSASLTTTAEGPDVEATPTGESDESSVAPTSIPAVTDIVIGSGMDLSEQEDASTTVSAPEEMYTSPAEEKDVHKGSRDQAECEKNTKQCKVETEAGFCMRSQLSAIFRILIKILIKCI